MKARMKVLTALLLVFCAGLANASASDKPSSTPSRSLLGSQLGYIPQGCPLTVSISADESDSSWFQDAPEIRGSITLSNPTSYNVPINNIIVQARSSNGLQYSTQVYCDGNGSPTVPYNPVPYTYGTLTCRYRLVLDRNVFGSYGQSGSRKLLGSGSVQANFFPGSSSGGSSTGSGSGGYGYFPPPDQRPTWTVTAIVTVSYSNAQCLSAPTPVNTDCWWSWLSSWYQRHHGWSWLFGSGRKLLMHLTGSGPGADASVVVGESVQASSDSSISRLLLGSHSEQGSSDSGSEHRHRHHHNHRHHMHTGSSESGRFSSGYSNSGRSLLNTEDSGSEHRHRHHNHHHHMHTGSSDSGSCSSGSNSGRSLLNTQDSGSEHRHRHHNHRHHMHMHSEHNSGSYNSRDSGRSLLHSESSSNSGTERSEHREHSHHHHNHHMASEHHSGSYGGGFSSGGYESGRSLLSTDGAADVQVVVPGSTVVDVNASAQDTDVQVENINTDADK